jgi:hypothetical protein
MPRSLEERLQPYERELKLAQEVLLFHRPLVLGFIIIGVLAFSRIVATSESGVLATITTPFSSFTRILVLILIPISSPLFQNFPPVNRTVCGPYRKYQIS